MTTQNLSMPLGPAEQQLVCSVLSALRVSQKRGIAAEFRELLNIVRWRFSKDGRAAVDALKRFAERHPKLACAFYREVHFFVVMGPDPMRCFLKACSNPDVATANAVAFISQMILESEMRSISPGRLTYLGELTLEAYLASLAELVAAGRYSPIEANKRERALRVKLGLPD